ncbi:FadR family transcriptional regulator [Psychrosphaera sp. B3R10]|uniref:FadR/GntR family transcriptional regulator n=1 Tax=Psychrosphaera algicola TaxID=3023714 RepID=A0ABT5FJ77_9GAMM|nr:MULTISPECIES: FadR/GntR family transcriptional regulator [unclassified Psychrosphaera]MBU2881216.1 FadR family transcriptional regulator [Psychrosphaera sp. I2R16]MBU2990059.1 FadR family transcriptional regulator [Psychrosphaera sp. B3R10]MDC2891231.1 FadR/GntR family transcriptional regulator [Psychrosphaera sp. G1-22]MDO6721223.1 FadR/GntR family transcriptional regulator [Psychrosphaera sp. 1_MG-2023]
MSELVYYDLKRAKKMTPSLSVQVARELGRRIVAGSFEAGALIEDENALADRFQVSRVVIRDAVKILVGKGLLDVRRGIGTKVRPRHEWILLDDDVLAWHITATPRLEFISQLMDIRLAFEPKAARWAAERATAEDIKVIDDACRRMEEETGSLEKFVVADALFHQAVLRAAHNEFLNAMEGVIYSALLVSVRITNQDPRKNSDSVEFHREVCDAISTGDADKAEKLTEKLLRDAIRRLKEAFGDKFKDTQLM